MKIQKRLAPKEMGVTNEVFEVMATEIDSNGANPGDVLTADGSGGSSWAILPSPIIDVTYAELVALIGSQDLIPGQQYRITDYATKHYIVDGDNLQYTTGDGIVTGVTEPLICLAVGVDEIHAEVKSEMYPQDIIYYDWDANNWLNDLSFGYDDGGGVAIISGWKGVIISRHDTLKQIKAPSDWRNCLTRRWETAATAWDSGTTYGIGNIVSHAATSMVYKSLVAANLNNEPTGADTGYWVVMLDLTTHIYWNASPTSWNGITSGAGYDDFLLFNSLADVFNVNIDTTVCHPVEGAPIILLLPRSTFFKDTFELNIGAGFSSNTIGAEFQGNTIGAGFYGNTIGAYFSSNTIGAGFTMNEVTDMAISSVDFTTATHVYGGYNCYLYKRPDGTAKLRYYDNSDVQQIVLPTA